MKSPCKVKELVPLVSGEVSFISQYLLESWHQFSAISEYYSVITFSWIRVSRVISENLVR